MQVNAQDIIDSVDLGKSEAFLPVYESIVNSIISLIKSNNDKGKIEVFIERKTAQPVEGELFDNNVLPIKNISIVDNGEGFTDANFKSFNAPFSKTNKKYGCKGIGRFTMLAMFRQIDVFSVYEENGQFYERTFSFNAEKEIFNHKKCPLNDVHNLQTKVNLVDCYNQELEPYTAKKLEDIAKGIKNHCFIYHLCNQLPAINVNENIAGEWQSFDVKQFFKLEAKDKEKTIFVKQQKFDLYILRNTKENNRKYNYVTFCANSRTVGNKKELSKVDSLYMYPITENGESKFLDVFVVSPYLDSHINNTRTGFKIPECNDGLFENENIDKITIEDILKAIAEAVAGMYETFAKETKKRTVEEARDYIKNEAPQYRSFLFRQDVLDRMPPHLSSEKKDEFFHKEAYLAEKKLDEKINEFVAQRDLNENSIEEMQHCMKETTAYNSDKLANYVMRRKAVIKLFRKMLDARQDGKYELESLIHNLIFPMGLTNKEITYQYHNLWLLDERFATYQFIASDKSITSFTKKRSSLEPDLVLIDKLKEQSLLDNRISFGTEDAGEIDSMVVFEFKRPGDTAHQKNRRDMTWDFADLVNKYFDTFMYGTPKKNYRGNPVDVKEDTPKFGYIIMDIIPKDLESYNLKHGWRRTPFGSYYKIYPDLNLHLETITFQNLLKNVEKRMNPFFDNLFAQQSL